MLLIDRQWWKVTKYIYLSSVFKHNIEVFVLYLSISNFQYLYFYSTSEANIVLLLHYNYLKTSVTSYFSDISYDVMKHNINYQPYFIHRLFENRRSTSSQRMYHVVSLQICYFQTFWYFWYFKYMLMPILLYFYSSSILNSGLILGSLEFSQRTIHETKHFAFSQRKTRQSAKTLSAF